MENSGTPQESSGRGAPVPGRWLLGEEWVGTGPEDREGSSIRHDPHHGGENKQKVASEITAEGRINRIWESIRSGGGGVRAGSWSLP